MPTPVASHSHQLVVTAADDSGAKWLILLATSVEMSCTRMYRQNKRQWCGSHGRQRRTSLTWQMARLSTALSASNLLNQAGLHYVIHMQRLPVLWRLAAGRIRHPHPTVELGVSSITWCAFSVQQPRGHVLTLRQVRSTHEHAQTRRGIFYLVLRLELQADRFAMPLPEEILLCTPCSRLWEPDACELQICVPENLQLSLNQFSSYEQRLQNQLG